MKNNKINIGGATINPNKYYTLRGLERILGGKIVSHDCSFIVFENDDWDDNLMVYISGQIEDGLRYKYMVQEAK